MSARAYETYGVYLFTIPRVGVIRQMDYVDSSTDLGRLLVVAHELLNPEHDLRLAPPYRNSSGVEVWGLEEDGYPPNTADRHALIAHANWGARELTIEGLGIASRVKRWIS